MNKGNLTLVSIGTSYLVMQKNNIPDKEWSIQDSVG